MTDQTPNYGLYLPDFDTEPWNSLVNLNFSAIDAIISAFFSLPQFRSIWDASNGATYDVDDIAVDAADGTLWTCLVGHVVSPTSQTFAQFRAALPTYWQENAVPTYTNLKSGRKNLLLNSGLFFNQHSAQTVTSATGRGYLADGFYCAIAGSGEIDVSHVRDEINGNYIKAVVSTADASLAASDLYRITSRLPGYSIPPLASQVLTLTFDAYATRTGTYSVAFRNGGSGDTSDRVYVTSYTVNTANTWETKTIQLTMDSLLAGTWDFTTKTGLKVTWVLAAGADHIILAGNEDQWVSAADYAVTSQANAMQTLSNEFRLRNIQLEQGSQATPLEQEPIEVTRFRCLEYREILRYIADDYFATGGKATGNDSLFVLKYSRKHTSPAAITESAPGDFQTYEEGTEKACTAVAFSHLGLQNARMLVTTASGGSSTGMLLGATGVASIDVDAELR